MLNKKLELIEKFFPVYDDVDFESLTSIGNGDYAINLDITGFQTLGREYLEKFNPITSMSNSYWRQFPADNESGKYTLDDLVFDVYETNDGRTVKYPANEIPKLFKRSETKALITNESEQIKNSEVYNWLRQNKHKASLGNFELYFNNEPVSSSQIKVKKCVHNLLTGSLSSEYQIGGFDFKVIAVPETELSNSELAACYFLVESEAFSKNMAKLKLKVYQHSPKIAAADLEDVLYEEDVDAYNSEFEQIEEFDSLSIRQGLLGVEDGVSLGSKIANSSTAKSVKTEFAIRLSFEDSGDNEFAKPIINPIPLECFEQALNNSKKFWGSFWEKVEVPNLLENNSIPLNESEKYELQRRIILSIYNLRIHSAGSVPPAETGLLCNSWYGKFHLEMHPWHQAWAPFFGVPEILERTMDWYLSKMDAAKMNAKRNNYDGLRWPKMVDLDAIDSPSFIAPLLIWQQSHPIFLIDLLANSVNSEKRVALLKKFIKLIQGTADFMASFVVEDLENGKFNLEGPLQCAQEEFEPTLIKNPTFELAYWKHSLKLAISLTDKFLNNSLNSDSVTKTELKDSKGVWERVVNNLAVPKPVDSLYPSHQNAPDTFPNFMKDHPIQLGILGMFENPDADKQALRTTLMRVIADWDEQSMWGWDYGYMSMLANSLGESKLAWEILLKDCPKNYYSKNGHNFQLGRNDLPAYLPGNGGLLWAVAKLLNLNVI